MMAMIIGYNRLYEQKYRNGPCRRYAEMAECTRRAICWPLSDGIAAMMIFAGERDLYARKALQWRVSAPKSAARALRLLQPLRQ